MPHRATASFGSFINSTISFCNAFGGMIALQFSATFATTIATFTRTRRFLLSSDGPRCLLSDVVYVVKNGTLGGVVGLGAVVALIRSKRASAQTSGSPARAMRFAFSLTKFSITAWSGALLVLTSLPIAFGAGTVVVVGFVDGASRGAPGVPDVPACCA